MKLLVLAVAAVITSGSAHARPPPCADWPTSMAFVHLKNAGAIDPATLDMTATRATLIAAHPVGRGVYKEIYDIIFREKGGRTVEVVTAHKASNAECSLSAVDVWVVAQRLGGS